MNLIQSFDEAGMLIQAIIKDTSYLELESRPERSKTFPVQQNKYQQSFCNVDFILDWTDSQKRKDLNSRQIPIHPIGRGRKSRIFVILSSATGAVQLLVRKTILGQK